MHLTQVYLFHPAQPASPPSAGGVASHVEELILEVPIKPTIYMIQANNRSHAVEERFFFKFNNNFVLVETKE